MPQPSHNKSAASTLKACTACVAENLVPVTLCAMLGLVAYSTYLDARSKSNVGIVRDRFAQISAGLEAYFIDNAAYPHCNTRGVAIAYGALDVPNVTTPDATIPVLERLTTPIAYIDSTSLSDPFELLWRTSGADAVALVTNPPIPYDMTAGEAILQNFRYQAWGATGRAQVDVDAFTPDPRPVARQWVLQSVGPDGINMNLGGVLANEVLVDGPALLIYDPTNGAVSFGSIFRIGGIVDPYVPTYAAGEGLRAAIGLNPNGPAEPGDVSGVKGFDRYE